jgi:hypothetical protein
VTRLLDEAEFNQFLECPRGGVSVDIALARGVADGICDLAVVPRTDLHIDGARCRRQGSPRIGREHVVVELKIAVLALFEACLAHHTALLLANAIWRDVSQLRVAT